jgi:cytochrome c553
MKSTWFQAGSALASRAPSVRVERRWHAAWALWIGPIVASLPCLAFAQSEAIPSFKDVDSIEARVQGCVTCHGQGGQGTANGYFPRIAGKPAGYLFNQLVAFRDGTRKYPPMNYLVAYLPDAYLHEIATHFSRQRPPFAIQDSSKADAATLARGRSLVTEGDFHTGVPPCMACHGARLTGMEPGIPGLAGLRPNYVVAQLTRWRVGERHAIAPDCMGRVAARLTDADTTAVAAWLATQPAPKDPSPEPTTIERMPYACGSQATADQSTGIRP